MYIYVIMIYMLRLVAIGEASQVLGVSIATLRHWSPSGLPLPRLHRAAQNENSNCRWAAVSALNSNNGRTNAWNNLVKSAEIM